MLFMHSSQCIVACSDLSPTAGYRFRAKLRAPLGSDRTDIGEAKHTGPLKLRITVSFYFTLLKVKRNYRSLFSFLDSC